MGMNCDQCYKVITGTIKSKSYGKALTGVRHYYFCSDKCKKQHKELPTLNKEDIITYEYRGMIVKEVKGTPGERAMEQLIKLWPSGKIVRRIK